MTRIAHQQSSMTLLATNNTNVRRCDVYLKQAAAAFLKKRNFALFYIFWYVPIVYCFVAVHIHQISKIALSFIIRIFFFHYFILKYSWRSRLEVNRFGVGSSQIWIMKFLVEREVPASSENDSKKKSFAAALLLLLPFCRRLLHFTYKSELKRGLYIYLLARYDSCWYINSF